MLVLALGLGGCTFAESQEDWRAGLSPAGPCYEANLLDGLDTASTEEAHAVFACLNATGALAPYAPLDAALDGASRDGVVGLVLARWVADLPLADLSLGALLDGGIALLEDPTGLFDALHLGFELVYGKPWRWLGASVPLNSQTSLDDGLLVPLLPTLGRVSGTLLDEDLAPLAPLADAVRADETKRLLWTLASIGVSTDPTLADLDAGWAPHLADALGRMADGDNDRWASATGHSLRDLATVVFTYESDGRLTLDHVAHAAAPLLGDAGLRDALGVVLDDQISAGRLDALPAQVLYLASVDARGGALSAGEDSALVALLRLLTDANREVDCSIDLLFFDVEINLGNLSVSLLELLARQNPATVDGGVGLLGDLLGVSLTEDILDTVADTGVCPVIDAQLVADLQSLDRLSDPETDELLYVLLDVLSAADDRGQLVSLVDVIAEVHTLGLVPPVEEVLRDAGDTALAGDVLVLLPVLLDPWAYHDRAYFPAGLPPLDYGTAWDTAATLLAPDADGRTPIAALAGPVKTLLGQDATWGVLGRFTTLVALPDAEIAGVLGLLDAACRADPTLAMLDDGADILADPALVRPLLVLAEADALRDAVSRTELTQEGPLPFTARLVHGGTLGVLLDTLRLFSTLLPEDEE